MSDPSDDFTDALAELVSLLSNVGPESARALEAGLLAAQTGVAGSLYIYFPKDPTEPLDVRWAQPVTGPGVEWK